MEKKIKTAGAWLRGLSTGRKRAAMAAMVGAVVAAVVGLAVPAGASPIAARPAAVTGAEHFQAMSTSGTATTEAGSRSGTTISNTPESVLILVAPAAKP